MLYIYTIQEPTNRVFFLSSLNHELENSMAINSSEDQFSYYKSSHNILASNDKFRTLNTTQITFLCVNGDENTYSCMLQWDTLLIQAPSRQRYIVQQPQSWWMQLWRETLCQDPPSWMIKDGSMVCQVPSRERIHIPPNGKRKISIFKKCVGKGYVGSQEGMPVTSQDVRLECWGHHSTQTNK